MFNGHTIGAVIPTDNREAFVEEILDDLPTFVDRAYVVDDGSPEDSWANIRQCIARYNLGSDDELADRIVPIRDDCKRGVGWAVKTGYQRACEEAIDVTVVLGVDDRMDPLDLERYLDGLIDDIADLQPLIAIDPEPTHV